MGLDKQRETTTREREREKMAAIVFLFGTKG